MTLHVGIDPGQSGGIAWHEESSDPHCIKMPETERDIYAHFGLLALLHSDAFAVIEKVGPMPATDKKGRRVQGIASTWKFSGNYHGLRMALIACGIPFEAVPPGTWQRAMGCLTKGDKNVTKRRAQEIFPSIRVTHAIADALLLMEYCRKIRANH